MSRIVITMLAAGSLLLPGTIHARYLTPDEALQNISANPGARRAIKAVNTDNYQLVYSVTDSVSQQSTLYMFTEARGGGFIVAAASDCVAPLLGCSDSDGTYAKGMNPEFDYWLQCYSDAIAHAEATGTTLATAPARASRSDIGALVKSTWNQSAPFNNECPIVAGGRSVTGCVATAFAQIMYYHKWPKVAGTGSHSYSWKVNNVTYNESMDFSTVTFDWANMKDSYSSYTTAQANAVAKLMHAVGVACEMGYTPSSSGAVTNKCAQALLNYWDYDKGASPRSRESYSLDDWSDIIYGELAAGRPVIYDGQSAGGGHCFICDGYRASDGCFHFNWGWGGYCDGYYMLTDLTPAQGGIGGTTTTDGYNSGQGLVIGLQPAIAGSTYSYSMEVLESIIPDAAVYNKTSWIRIYGRFSNASLMDMTMTYGLKLVDRTDPSNVKMVLYTPEEYFTDSSWSELPVGYYFTSLTIRGLVIPAGSWDASFIFKTKDGDGQWQEMTVGPDIVGTFRIDANNSSVAFGGAALPAEKHFQCINTDITPANTLYKRTASYIRLSTGSYWNATGVTTDFHPALKYQNVDDPTMTYYGVYKASWSLPAQYSYNTWYGTIPSDIPAGDYIITPAYQVTSTGEILDFDRNSAIKDYCTAYITSQYVGLDGATVPATAAEIKFRDDVDPAWNTTKQTQSVVTFRPTFTSGSFNPNRTTQNVSFTVIPSSIDPENVYLYIHYDGISTIDDAQGADHTAYQWYYDSEGNPNGAVAALADDASPVKLHVEVELLGKDENDVTHKVPNPDAGVDWGFPDYAKYFGQNQRIVFDNLAAVKVPLLSRRNKVTVTATGDGTKYSTTPVSSTRYYAFSDDAVTGVEAVSADDSSTAVRYYNLQGVEIANPGPGIYIRIQGTNSTKILIK